MAQPQLRTTNLSAGWLWPKGVYTLAIHDGPGPRTEEIAAYLAAAGKVADFFQTICHYDGQPWPDWRSAMCHQVKTTPRSLLERLLSLHQCTGNHGQDHLDTPMLNQADTAYQIGGPALFFEPAWERQNCPALVTFPGFQIDAQHIDWLNRDPVTGGRQQGPIGADFTGSGTLQTAAGPVSVGSDQDCFAQGYSQQQCLGLMLDAMKQANHGGIVNIHDYNPYSWDPTDPFDLKSGYAYDYLAGIIDGCQAANGGTACVWLPPDAIPGVHRDLNAGPFGILSDSSDDFSDRIADVIVGDINGDNYPDVVVPRQDGLYCALNAGNGRFYPLARCLAFTGDSMRARQYWLVDVEGHKLPHVVWLNATGMVGAKANGHGGFHPEIRNLSAGFWENETGSNVYPNSIRFGRMRGGSSQMDEVAMSPMGVVIAANNGHGFDPPQRVPQLTYQGAGDTAWNPQRAGQEMALVDLFGEGPLDIVVLGNAGLLYSRPSKTGFTAFSPLTARDGFDYWSSPQVYTSIHATQIAGRTAIAAWTPFGIAFSNFGTADRRAVVNQFKVICSDCFPTLPGWLDEWQQSNRATIPGQAGFADFKLSGAPQAYVVWGKGLYSAEIETLAGYR